MAHHLACVGLSGNIARIKPSGNIDGRFPIFFLTSSRFNMPAASGIRIDGAENDHC